MIGIADDVEMWIGNAEKIVMFAMHQKCPKWKNERVSSRWGVIEFFDLFYYLLITLKVEAVNKFRSLYDFDIWL